VPDAAHWPDGCRFRGRCPLAEPDCARVPPLAPALTGGPDHHAACWHQDRLGALA
jgi:peptide/nickel transport system ATP-binding protein